MAAFTAKAYQQGVLDSVEAYFRVCNELGDADTAFYQTTRQLWGEGVTYRPIDGFDAAMPYFCLRVPTGGGKTWLAARSVALTNTHLLRSEHSVILWLVPSNAIREQTIAALRGLDHPYRAALREAGRVSVLDLDEAKAVTPATLDTSTTIIVCTRQSFQVEDPQIRKVYESNGALMPHFQNLSDVQKAALLRDDDGTAPCSLLNVLRLRRPFVIVDEAHNSRTSLAFETLARFRPSGILELTATPDETVTPSNVLHSVSAAELKTEHMIKLPILLECEPDWQQCLHYAIDRRNQLQHAAESERRGGADYLRPIVLIQAEARSQARETRDVDHVQTELTRQLGIPEDEIVVATGAERGLEKLSAEYANGIANERCPVKYVITQQALAEGWDCPSAYVLVSLANIQTATSVEQLLGRILRQPAATHRDTDALNQSYAYVVSDRFSETASALRDRLVDGAGFERREVKDFVRPSSPEQTALDLETSATRTEFEPFAVELSEKPNTRKLARFKDKVAWDADNKHLVFGQPLTQTETESLQDVAKGEEDRERIEQAAAHSREQAADAFFQTPAERGERLRVPQLALRVQGELELFEDPAQLQGDWEPSPYDATPTHDELQRLKQNAVASGGAIDVTQSGRVTTEFMKDMQRDLGLSYEPEHWDETRLATWLCKNLPAPTITHQAKRTFVAYWLQALLRYPAFDLARANRQKFLLRELIEARIRDLQRSARQQAYQVTLFDDSAESNAAVSDEYSFEFPSDAYAPSRYYDGHYRFKKHYYGEIGAFDTDEEFQCACWLDQQAERGRIDFWVRNPVRKAGCSFFLQKADGRFYPDFICRLPSGRILVVEYKGADRWQNAEDDRLIGNLWAQLSDGRCRFVMVTNKDWPQIEAELEN